MQKGKSRLSAGLAGLAVLAGCAGAQTAEDYRVSLQTVTATALGVSDAAAITVTDESRVNAKWTWKASTGGKTYACDADDQMRLPSCAQTT